MELQQKSIDTLNGPVQYFTCGRGKPMLLLHGFLGRPQDFRWILPMVSQHYEAFLPELPGMVSTPLGNHPALDQKGMAGFVEQFLNSMNIERCIIIGHSMGAGVAVGFAARFPHRVSSLGLISPVSHRMHQALRRIRPDVGARLLGGRWSSLFWPVARWLLRRMGFPRGVTDESILNSMRFNTLFDYELHKQALSSIRAPLLLAYCEDDPQIETTIFLELESLVSATNVLRFKQGGHNPQRSHADLIAKAILELGDDLEVR